MALEALRQAVGLSEFTGTIDGTTASSFHIANTANSVLKFDAAVGTASIRPTITFDGGLGVLDLTSNTLPNFHATVANFASGEGIKVTGAAAAVLDSSGTFMTVYDAAHNSLGSINLSTSYLGDDFVVSGGTISVEVDTTTPTGRTPDLLAASDSGVLSTDNVTSVTGPTFSVALNGTAAVGDTVQLLLNGSPLSHPVTHTITFADLDSGSVNLTVAAGDLGADGSKSISAKLTDLAGHVSTTSALVVTLDTTAPTGGAPDLIAACDTGSSSTDNLTKQTAPTFQVALDPTVQVGDTVELKLGGGSLTHPVLHTITAGDVAAGSVQLAVTAGDLGADGAKSFTAVFADTAGNTSTTSALSITLDTAAPTGGTPDLIAVSDTGSSSTDNLTTQTAPTFQVALDPTVQAGDTVELKLGGGSLTHPVLHTITAGDVAAGTVQLAVSAGDLGADGSKSFTAVFADAAGNTSTTSALSITLDTTAPTGGTPDLIAASDTGSSSTDNVTKQTAPTFQVALDPTVQAGDTVELKLGGGSLTHPVLHSITAVDVAAGFVQLAVTAGDLGADGSKSFTAVFADAAGNTSTTGPLSITLDTTAPTASIALNAITADNILNAAEAGGTVAVTGTVGGDVQSGDTVTLTVNGHAYTGAVSSGGFSINVAGSDLAADADHTVDASVITTDAAGNSATATATKSLCSRHRGDGEPGGQRHHRGQHPQRGGSRRHAWRSPARSAATCRAATPSP